MLYGFEMEAEGTVSFPGLLQKIQDGDIDTGELFIGGSIVHSLDAEAKKVLNQISSKLTTSDLVTLNSQVQIQHQDPDAVAKAWLEQHNFGM